MLKLGNTIKRLREAKNVSLSDLSKLSGIQLATLSRIEHDKMTGSVRSHENLSKVLGLKLGEFYKESEKDM